MEKKSGNYTSSKIYIEHKKERERVGEHVCPGRLPEQNVSARIVFAKKNVSKRIVAAKNIFYNNIFSL